MTTPLTSLIVVAATPLLPFQLWLLLLVVAITDAAASGADAAVVVVVVVALASPLLIAGRGAVNQTTVIPTHINERTGTCTRLSHAARESVFC